MEEIVETKPEETTSIVEEVIETKSTEQVTETVEVTTDETPATIEQVAERKPTEETEEITETVTITSEETKPEETTTVIEENKSKVDVRPVEEIRGTEEVTTTQPTETTVVEQTIPEEKPIDREKVRVRNAMFIKRENRFVTDVFMVTPRRDDASVHLHSKLAFFEIRSVVFLSLHVIDGILVSI